MNIKDDTVKNAYGEIKSRGKGLFLYRKNSRKEVVPSYSDGFEVKTSTNQSFHVFESYYVEYDAFSCPVLILKDGKITSTGVNRQIKDVKDFDGISDGTNPIRVRGNILYTSKPSLFIGRGGSNVKLLSKYLGKLKIEKLI